MDDAAEPEQRCRFGPLDIAYDRRVLVPRAWTLEQSRWAAELSAEAAPGPLLELCAGVGQIGLAAAVLAGRDLVQVELDPVAAAYAVANAARAGWADRVQVRVRRLQHAVGPDERFAVVIADPPYLRTGEMDRFPADPRLAIDGGADGLDVVRDCLDVAARHLVEGGALVLQVAGPGQADEVEALAAASPRALVPAGRRVVDHERAVLLLRHPGRADE